MTDNVVSSQKPPKKQRKKRAWELDFLRGFAILMVVFDHAMVTIGFLFRNLWLTSESEGLAQACERAMEYLNSSLRAVGWPIFIIIFFGVSGLCTAFSRNNFFRGIRLTVFALLITLCTYLFELILGVEGLLITFGVIHCISACILLYALLSLVIRLFNRRNNRFIKSGILLAVGAVLLVLNKLYNVPFSLVSNTYVVVDSDSFFLGFFMIGAGLAGILYPNRKSLLPAVLDKPWHYPFTIPGRLSLLIYIASQVVIFAVCALITYSVMGVLY